MTQGDFVRKALGPDALLKPQRITITVPQAVYQKLGEMSFRQGRSMSNLACFLLEQALQD